MQSENNQISGIFQIVRGDQFAKVQDQVIFQVQVSLIKFKNHTHRLFLTSKYIFLVQIASYNQKNLNTQAYQTKLDFQLSFKNEFANHSSGTDWIGIRFFRGEQNQCAIYTFNQYNLSVLEKNLLKFINQRGFHQLYTPLKKLGRGHFAHVYHVTRLSDGQDFAVKAFSKDNIYSVSTGKESLQNQIQIMKHTSNASRNLLNLIEVFQTDKSVYVVLQLVLGKNFGQIIQQRPAGFRYQQVKVLLKGILNGVKCLHDRKIMHRDLKPQNIVFRTQNIFQSPQRFDPVIVDFGMATRYDKPKYIFYRCGTPGFVAPQVANLQIQAPYSPICDVFSIGCLFHLMMTGYTIFSSNQTDQLLQQNNKVQFTILTDRVQNCHPYAMDLLLKLVEKQPSKRIRIQQALLHPFFNEQLLKSSQFVAKKNSFTNFFGLFSD